MFLINNEIYFDPESRKLIVDDKSLQLTDNMSRCLLVLLLNRGNVVTKETLLKEVWQKNGVIVTETSIRQTLSQLRKAFINIGHNEEIIFTLPRQGYKVSSISENASSEKESDDTNLNEDAGDNSKFYKVHHTLIKSTFPYKSTLLIILLIVVTTVACMYAYVQYLFIFHVNYTVISDDEKRSVLVIEKMTHSGAKIDDALEQLDYYIEHEIITTPLEYNVYINETLHKNNYSYFICNRQSGKSRQCQSVMIYSRLTR